MYTYEIEEAVIDDLINAIDTTPLVAGYGTLRVGHGNWSHFLDGVGVHAQDVAIAGFKMYTFGGFPAVFRTDNPEDIIYADVFNVNESTVNKSIDVLNGIERLEGSPQWYMRELVDTVDGYSVWLYVMPDHEMNGFPEYIESGDWNDYVEEQINYG
jgi:gamma-glutamylcyclotransferase (GGCT)/AIG2-like uncharacterized protein YtfP